MYNAVKIYMLCIAVVMLGLFAACKDNSRAEAADKLLAEARQLTEACNYDGAMNLLDTLDVKFRDCIEQRKQGTRLRAEALIAMISDSISADDARRPQLIAALEALQPMFKKVDIAGTDGFYVFKKIFTGKEMNSTGIQARVDEKGYFFVIANNVGHKIGLNALQYGNVMTLRSESMAVEGSEIMSLPQESITDFSDAIAGAPDGALKIEFVGSKGRATVKLSAAQAEAYKQTWQYAKLKQAVHLANVRREKYERQLAAMQEKLAALPVETEK